MGEQMSDGRAGRPSRIVEPDDALVERHERADGTRELGHRRPGKVAVELAVDGLDASRRDERDRGVGARPKLDLP